MAIKLIHASCLDPPLAGRGYYLASDVNDPKPVLSSMVEAVRAATIAKIDIEVIRPPKRSPLTQRQRNERSGRVGWVKDAVVWEIKEMLDNLEEKCFHKDQD